MATKTLHTEYLKNSIKSGRADNFCHLTYPQLRTFLGDSDYIVYFGISFALFWQCLFSYSVKF